MDKRTIQSILQDKLEEQIPSAEIDLWSTVEQGLVAGLSQQGEKMKTTQPRRVSRAALITLAIAALLALALITPQGRALAQTILRFFIHAESDTLVVPTAVPYQWVEVTPGAPLPTLTPAPAEAPFAAVCGDYSNPVCSVEQMRSMVDFPLREPAYLPSGFYFVGATGGPKSIQLLYYHENQDGSLLVTVEHGSGTPSPQTDLIGSSAVVEEVQVGDLVGEYFKGTFAYTDGDSTATWDPDFGNETLRWVDGDLVYTLQYFYPPSPMGKEGMLAIANSMTTNPVEKAPTPTPDIFGEWDPHDMYNLSVPEAEGRAGFQVLLPTRLPEILILIGARYQAEDSTIWVYYQLDPSQGGSTSNGLLLREQAVSSPEGCELCDIAIGDYNPLAGQSPSNVLVVPPDAALETVQIGSVTGKYVEGVWSGTDCCGWQWDPMPYMKTLRWWANGRAFELSYTGMELQKEDLLSIAASIQ